MKKNIYKILTIIILIILILLIETKTVFADIGTRSSLASSMSEEYINNIQSKSVNLSEDMEFAEFSKINSDFAILYENNNSNKKNITVCVNAGHGTSGVGNTQTQCHPDGSAKVTGGTTEAGAVTAIAVSSGMDFLDGTEEKVVTLKEALLLKDVLLYNGYNVLMIREDDDVQLDNIARTVLANTYANCHVALHWNYTDYDKGAFYMSVPNVESYKNMYPVSTIWQKSNAFGESLINGLSSVGVKILPERCTEADLTQTSYSKIPSIDIELGDKGSDISEENLKAIANGLLAGIAEYYNNNEITYPDNTSGNTSGTNSNNGSANSSQNKENKMIEGLKKDFIGLLDIFLGFLDGVQNIVNLFATVELGTAKDATILYPVNNIQTNSTINEYVNLKTGTVDSEADFQVDGKDEGFSNSTSIPFIPVEVHSIAAGCVNNFDTNFLTGQHNIEKHKSGSLWVKIRNIVASLVHITIYLSAGLLIMSLIWHGINIVRNSITPNEKKEHLTGLENFIEAVFMLVGSVIIMAMCIFLTEQIIDILKIKNGTEFPYIMSVKTANYTFSTNITGYIRFLSQINLTDKLLPKVGFTFLYAVCIVINIIVVLTMLRRMIWLIILAVLGPVIAVAHSFEFKKVMGLTFKDWTIMYIKWSSIQVILALFCSFILSICRR